MHHPHRLASQTPSRFRALRALVVAGVGIGFVPWLWYFGKIAFLSEAREWFLFILITSTGFVGAFFAVRRENLPGWMLLFAAPCCTAFACIVVQSLGWWPVIAGISASFAMSRAVLLPRGIAFRLGSIAVWTVAWKFLWFTPRAGVWAAWIVGMIAVGWVEQKRAARTLWSGPPRFSFLWHLGVLAGAIALIWNWPIADPIGARHHWSFYVGPIELARQGYEYFRTIPSQYGFLSVWIPASLLAWPPVHALWISVASATTIFFVIFYVACRPRTGTEAVFAFILGVVFVLYLPGWPGRGFLAYPSVGAYRFLLPVLLAWSFERNDTVARQLLSVSVWVAALAWSAETAVYSTGVAIAAIVIGFVERKKAMRPLFVRSDAARAVVWVGALTALLVFATSVTEVSVFDICRRYVQFPRAYAAGFGSLPADPRGPVWIAIGLAAFFFPVVFFGTWRGNYGGWLGVYFGTLTYFVGRSHDANLSNLAPIWILGLLRGEALVRRRAFQGLFRQWTIALSVVAIAGAWAVARTSEYPRFGRGYFAAPDFAGHPTLTEVQRAAFLQVQETEKRSGGVVDLTELLTYIDWGHTYRLWLPISPAPAFRILPPAEQRRYLLEALAERHPESGWLVRPTDGGSMYETIAEVLRASGGAVQKELSLEGPWVAEFWELRHHP